MVEPKARIISERTIKKRLCFIIYKYKCDCYFSDPATGEVARH